MSDGLHPMHTYAPLAMSAADKDPAACHYRVFLSYSHADANWARWLLRRLEGYRVPDRFQGQAAPIGRVGPRLAPVFRDRDELPSTSDLGQTIRAGLSDSATLVVVCSPRAAQSRWVQEEIVAFKRLHGESRVFAFIVAGEPNAQSAAAECFSPGLQFALGADGQLSPVAAEVVAADARPHADGKETAFLRLVAGLIGVGFDELRQRELHRRHQRMTLITAGAVFGMALTLGLAALAWQARNDARRRLAGAERLVAFILGDLWTRLESVGRLDVLDAAGDELIAYLESLNPRDLTDNLLASHAKALTQIGRTRTNQARFPAAARAFSMAYERAAALAGRHPLNFGMLFERAQAEYWIGFVHWTRGDLGPATEWMTRYHESSAALLKLDPSSLSSRREYLSSQHNFSAFNLDQNRFELARAGFQQELVELNQLLVEVPGNPEVLRSIADVVSYFGTLAERSGDYREALGRYEEYARRFELMLESNPKDARAQDRLANAVAMEATVLEIAGQREEALAHRRRAGALARALVQHDPGNTTWRHALLKLELKEALLVRAMGHEAAAAELGSRARSGLEKLHQAEPANRSIAGHLMSACRLEAQLRARAGRPDAAASGARALLIGEDLIAKARANDEQVSELARACLVVGEGAAQQGDLGAARRHWQRALEITRARMEGSSNWRLLDPAARALAHLGRAEESRALITRLDGFGYRPLEAWPEPLVAVTFVRNPNPEK
jgi:tetratricopeptide (TPR) repeat protein